MLDGIITLLGGGLGGLLRLAPELIKFFNKKTDNAHELAMMDKQLEVDKARGQMELDKISAQGQVVLDQGGLEALREAIKGQSVMSGVKWIDGLSQLMRPLITLQWVIILYPAVIIATYMLMLQAGTPALEALVKSFGSDEKAMVAGIVNFWFLDRVIKHRK